MCRAPVRGFKIEQAGPVVSVLLDRPAARNALTQEMWQCLPAIVEKACAHEEVRLAVLGSTTPGIFSAGADITEYREHLLDAVWTEESQRVVTEAMNGLARVPVPTLAVIDGPCIGGAVGLTVACDQRIATPRSTFAVTAARLGTVYPFQAIVGLVDLVGAGAAKRMLFTGSAFDAEAAAAMGLVDDVVDEAGLTTAIDQLAEYLGSTSRTAVRLLKFAVQRVISGQRTPDAATASLLREALSSRDYHEGVTAFMERRPAAFGS